MCKANLTGRAGRDALPKGGGSLNNRVRELRENKELTQGALAEKAGVSRQTINAIETGKYDPSIWLAHSLSKIFEMTIEDIFLFEEGGSNEKE